MTHDLHHTQDDLEQVAKDLAAWKRSNGATNGAKISQRGDVFVECTHGND
jgi:hypothetical protein